MKKNFKLQDIDAVAAALIKGMEHHIVCLYGDMGAGKTTLVKSILKVLGAVDLGSSPTFGLVNEYQNTHGELLAYHFDFYRIQSQEEALDLGLEEYFERGVPVFMEWPEKINDLLPNDYHKISLSYIDETTRSVEFLD